MASMALWKHALCFQLFAAVTLCSKPAAVNSTPLLIQGGTVVNADRAFEADVLVEGGIIAQVGAHLKAPKGARVLDAHGKLVLPGGIDPHTHLDSFFQGLNTTDDYYHGQAAALAGGTTFHINFALPVDGDVRAGFQEQRALAEKSVMDYGLHMAVNTWNDKVEADLAALVVEGVNSVKFFLAYKGALQVSDAQLVAGLRACRRLGALTQVHAENGDAVADGQERMVAAGITGPEGHYLSRPAVLEAEATARAIRLAAYVNTPLYVVHVMAAAAAKEVADARAQGLRVIGETVTSAIALNESHVWRPDFKYAAQYVMSPPIRSEADRRQVAAALAGGALQVVGTDHCAFNSSLKARGAADFRRIPNGVNGIEERLHVVWDEMVNTGRMTPPDFVRVTSTAAAQAFNVYPRKGVIAAGSDADIILLDPQLEHVISAATHHSKMDTNIFEGRWVKGKVTTTISQGNVVWHDGKLSVQRGAGRFVRLPAFGPLFEGLDKQDQAHIALHYPYGPTPVRRGSIPARDEL